MDIYILCNGLLNLPPSKAKNPISKDPVIISQSSRRVYLLGMNPSSGGDGESEPPQPFFPTTMAITNH